MTQRVTVRIRVMYKNRTLLIRRRENDRIVHGQYELPGGRVLEGEQPEDSVKRWLVKSTGLKAPLAIELDDVLTYMDKTRKPVQYTVITYKYNISDTKRAIHLNGQYDKYIWYEIGKLTAGQMTDVSKMILGTISLPIIPRSIPNTKQAKYTGVVVYTDGGSRGNPGHSAAGYVVIKDNIVIDQGGEYIGITTNNQAEYHGVKLGLKAALRLNIDTIEMRIDSMMVVNQLNNIYKIKNRELWPINERILELVKRFNKVKFVYVPREFNQLADGMVNRTLDRHQKVHLA